MPLEGAAGADATEPDDYAGMPPEMAEVIKTLMGQKVYIPPGLRE